jgi:hypothetical protein
MRVPQLGRWGWFLAYWVLGVAALGVVGLAIRTALN